MSFDNFDLDSLFYQFFCQVVGDFASSYHKHISNIFFVNSLLFEEQYQLLRGSGNIDAVPFLQHKISARYQYLRISGYNAD